MVGLCPGVDVKAGCIPNIGTPHVLPSLSCMLTKMYGHGAMPHDTTTFHISIASPKICLIAFAALKTVLQPGCWEVLKLDHPHHTTFSPHGKAKHVMDICDQVYDPAASCKASLLASCSNDHGSNANQFPGLLTRASFGLKLPVYATSVWL